MFTKIEHANDENEQKDEAAFIFKPVSVEACRCGGGKALSTASFPQTHRKNAAQAGPTSVVSVRAFRVACGWFGWAFLPVHDERSNLADFGSMYERESKSPRSHQVKKLPRLIAKSRENF